jgi:hypothetical protein
MPRKPNYKFERLERERKKAAKKAERAEAKREKAAQRQAEQQDSSPTLEPEAPE